MTEAAETVIRSFSDYDTLDQFAADAAGVVAGADSAADACTKLLVLGEDPRVEDDLTAVVVRRRSESLA